MVGIRRYASIDIMAIRYRWLEPAELQKYYDRLLFNERLYYWTRDVKHGGALMSVRLRRYTRNRWSRHITRYVTVSAVPLLKHRRGYCWFAVVNISAR